MIVGGGGDDLENTINEGLMGGKITERTGYK